MCQILDARVIKSQYPGIVSNQDVVAHDMPFLPSLICPSSAFDQFDVPKICKGAMPGTPVDAFHRGVLRAFDAVHLCYDTLLWTL